MVLSATLKIFDMSRPKIPLSHYTKLIVQINHSKGHFLKKGVKKSYVNEIFRIVRIGFPISVRGIFCNFFWSTGF